MSVMKLVSAVLLCACVLIVHTSAANHHNKHHEKHRHKNEHKVVHHHTHNTVKHKHNVKHNNRQNTLPKHDHADLDKKNKIPESNLAKKFDITPHPQKRPVSNLNCYCTSYFNSLHFNFIHI